MKKRYRVELEAPRAYYLVDVEADGRSKAIEAARECAPTLTHEWCVLEVALTYDPDEEE